MKLKLIQKRNNAEQRDYLQKSGALLVKKEIESLSIEEAYYLVLERECKIQGYDSYKEIN